MRLYPDSEIEAVYLALPAQLLAERIGAQSRSGRRRAGTRRRSNARRALLPQKPLPPEFAGRLRRSLDLPGRQLELVKALHATGRPVIVVLMNGRPLTINWIAENRYTSKYYDLSWTPLYPFGYGLSYTQFRLTNLQLSAERIRPDGRLTVSVEVENTGKRAGDEVVQLYLRDVTASVTRPVKELKGFQRITLRAGEKRRVEFTPEHLGFWNQKNRFVIEPGDFKVTVGNSSESGLEATFTVMK